MWMFIQSPEQLIQELCEFEIEDYESGYLHFVARNVCASIEELEECFSAIEKKENSYGIDRDFSVIGAENDAREAFFKKNELIKEYGLNGYCIDSMFKIDGGKILHYNSRLGWIYISESLLLPTKVFYNEDRDEEQIEIRYKAHGKIRSLICSPSNLEDTRYVNKLKDHGVQLLDPGR